MARPPKFTADDILDAAAEVAAERWRDATSADVAARLGAPSGSVYYRFPSRDELFVSLWLRAIDRFHVQFLAALRGSDARTALVDAAVSVPRFCREHPLDAVAMTLFRQDELVRSAPTPLRERVQHVNDEVIAQMHELTARRYGTADERRLQLVAIACQESPYGLVRRWIGGERSVPEWLDEIIRTSSIAILQLGDTADDHLDRATIDA